MPDPALRDLRLFVAAARAGSLSAGSRALDLSPNAASVAVSRVEGLLGVRLIQRTTRSMALTSEGEVYLSHAVRVLDAVDAAQMAVGPLRDELHGPIRLAAPTDLAERHLVPMLTPFLQQHPGVRLDVLASDAVANIVGSRVDLAVRYGALPDSDLMARRLTTTHRVAVASPDYLAAHPPLSEPADLAQHRILQWHAPRTTLTHWGFHRDGESRQVALSGSLLANDGRILKRWAVLGLGIAYKAHLDVAHELAQGTLVDVLSDWRGDALPLHAVWSGRAHQPARVAALVAALRQSFAEPT